MLEGEVQAVQDMLKVDSDELASWEEQSAVAKSKALFFRSLYTTPKKKPEPGSAEESDSREDMCINGHVLTDFETKCKQDDFNSWQNL
eukprot:gene7276-390_t